MDIKKLHQQAEDLREQGKLLGALKLYEEVIVGYQQEKNYSDLIEALSGRALTYKHFFYLTKDIVFAYLSKSDITTAFEICDNYQLTESQYKLFFNLGETEILFQKYSEAVINFQKSIDLYPGDDSQKGRYYEHLGEAQYLNGDTEAGLRSILLGLDQIRKFKSETDSFLINVWESGCLMKLFSFTKDKKYLDEAQKIIYSNPRLVIRKRQISELSQNL